MREPNQQDHIDWVNKFNRFVVLLETLDHAGGRVLSGDAGGGAGRDSTGDFQQRPRHAVHQPAVHREVGSAQVRISMDSRGRYLDNIFVERLWRSVKYEEVYLNEYEDVWEAERRIGLYFEFYNRERPHQSLGNRTPQEVYGAKVQ